MPTSSWLLLVYWNTTRVRFIDNHQITRAIQLLNIDLVSCLNLIQSILSHILLRAIAVSSIVYIFVILRLVSDILEWYLALWGYMICNLVDGMLAGEVLTESCWLTVCKSVIIWVWWSWKWPTFTVKNHHHLVLTSVSCVIQNLMKLVLWFYSHFCISTIPTSKFALMTWWVEEVWNVLLACASRWMILI